VRLPDPHNSYAVLIGTSTYRSTELADLPAVANNLDGLTEVLTDPALGVLPAERCVVLADPTDVRTLYRTLRRYAALAQDTLIVYFAGHGRTDPRNELYLGLTDTDTDELRVSAVPFDLIREVFGDSPATKRVLILDCCFSGRAIPDMSGPDEAILGQVDIEGTYTLTATPANAVALAPAGATYTAFTGELLTLLRTGLPDGPELLTFTTIYRQLLRTMITRGLPRPQQRGTGTVDQLALTRNPAHRAGNRDVVIGLLVLNRDLGREREVILRYRWFCHPCDIGGELILDNCPRCGTPTTRSHRRAARFRVPAQPSYGEKIRLAGIGPHDMPTSPAGDLYIELRQGLPFIQRLKYAFNTPAREQRTSGQNVVGGSWVSSGGVTFRFR
jgi:Caspase domain